MPTKKSKTKKKAAKKKAVTKKRKVVRNSTTGRFTKKSDARTNPRGTETESV